MGDLPILFEGAFVIVGIGGIFQAINAMLEMGYGFIDLGPKLMCIGYIVFILAMFYQMWKFS